MSTSERMTSSNSSRPRVVWPSAFPLPLRDKSVFSVVAVVLYLSDASALASSYTLPSGSTLNPNSGASSMIGTDAGADAGPVPPEKLDAWENIPEASGR